MQKLRQIIRQTLLEFKSWEISGQYNIPKNDPYVVDYDDPQREEIGDDVYAMTRNSYLDMGGHFKINKRADIEKYGQAKQGQWLVMDVDEDPQADIALMGKKDPGIPGIALGSAATDGTAKSKKAMKDLMDQKIKEGLWWGSASGKVGVSLINRGTPSLVNEEDIVFFEPDIYKYYGEYPLPVGAKDDSGMAIGALHPFRQRNGWFSRLWKGEEHFKLVFTGSAGFRTEPRRPVSDKRKKRGVQ